MAKFVIAAENMKKVHADLITNYLKGRPWGFWHWLENLWLLDGVPDRYTAQGLYNELIEQDDSLDSGNFIVIRVDAPITYWGRATKGAWEWFKTTSWGTPG